MPTLGEHHLPIKGVLYPKCHGLNPSHDGAFGGLNAWCGVWHASNPRVKCKVCMPRQCLCVHMMETREESVLHTLGSTFSHKIHELDQPQDSTCMCRCIYMCYLEPQSMCIDTRVVCVDFARVPTPNNHFGTALYLALPFGRPMVALERKRISSLSLIEVPPPFPMTSYYITRVL